VSEHARLSISVGPDDHSRGPLDAKLTVVEYGDYQCPYCGQAHPIVERMRTAFADSMRLIFRNLPLVDVHPHAEAAAEIAEAVGEQGKFWRSTTRSTRTSTTSATRRSWATSNKSVRTSTK